MIMSLLQLYYKCAHMRYLWKVKRLKNIQNYRTMFFKGIIIKFENKYN